MKLTSKSLSSFKEIYKEEIESQDELTDMDFERLARKTINIYKAIYGTSNSIIPQ
jgi:hypothetical protein